MGSEQKAEVKKKERRNSRVRAVLAGLVVLAAIAATFATTSLQSQKETLADVEVGECYTGEPTDLGVVDCTEQHNGELIARLEADDPDGDFPEDELGDPMSLRCEDELTEYFGADRETAVASGLTIAVYTPTESDWADGNRETDCVAMMEDGSAFTGSIEGSGADAEAES
jgi:hypothetical protein